jgi:protein KRI1
MDGHIRQSDGKDKTKVGDMDSKRRLVSSLKSSDIENDQSSNIQKAKKKKKQKTKSEKSDEYNCVALTETQSVPGMPKKHNKKKVSGKKLQKLYRQNDQSEKEEHPAISDARLRAYGINPKKFKNKLKYGNKQATFIGVRHSV